MTSEEFKTAISEPDREFKSKISFPALLLDTEIISNIDINSSLVFNEDFEIGTAGKDTAKIELLFVEGEPGLDYNYEDKECNIELGIRLQDESIEFKPMGLFRVEKAIKKNNSITLDCVDRMYKAEKDYISNLMYPTTVLEILQSACEQADIELATTSFANANHIVPNEPIFENITCRTIFAQAAELAGGYAKINRQGELEILTLDNTVVRDITKDHYFELSQDEVAIGKIDKVIVKVGEEIAEQGIGENIYTIVDNIFVQNPADVVDNLYNVLKNVDYTACEFSWQGDFSLELGDRVNIDGYKTYILDRSLKYTGGLKEDYKSPAKSNVEKNSTGKGSLTLDIENVKTQIKVIDGEIRQTIERIENLVIDAANRLYQSKTGIPFDLNIGTGYIQLFRDSMHPYYKVISNSNIDLSASFPNSQYAENLEGEEVTISLDVLVDIDRIINLDNNEFEVKANRWTRIYVTKEFPVNNTKNIRVRNPFSRKLTRDKVIGTKLIESLTTDINIIYYRNLQVQKGSVMSRHTLTPEELEENVNRLTSEFKQLEDSISLLVSRNDSTGRFEVNADNIVAEINKTDGVGRVKTTKVTVDENGLTVDDGAVIIRDSNNATIITSDGLRVMYIFTSSGELDGWQPVGIWTDDLSTRSRMASLSVHIPEDIIIDTAQLHTRSMSSYWTGHPSVPDGYYHARNLRLYEGDASQGALNFPYASSYSVFFGQNGIDITDAAWGGNWAPVGQGIVDKVGDVKKYLMSGSDTVFTVETTDPASPANSRYMGAIQLELVITGFLRG